MWIGEGSSRKATRQFFEWLSDARGQIEAFKLEELLSVNAPPAAAYVLKDQLTTLWFADDEATARGV